MAKRRIGEILQEFGLVSGEDVEEALKEQTETGKMLGEILVDKGLVKSRDLWQAWQSQVAHSPEAIYGISVPKKVSELALGDLASIYSVVPLYESPGKLTVIMMRPHDITAIDDMRVFLDDEINTVIAANKTVADAVREHHPDIKLRCCDHCGKVLEDADTMIFFNMEKRKLVVLCKSCFPKQEKKD
jgi:type IV pilus assembly protein PilB